MGKQEFQWVYTALHPFSQCCDLNWTLGIQTKHGLEDVAVLCTFNVSFKWLLYVSFMQWQRHMDPQVEDICLYFVCLDHINPQKSQTHTKLEQLSVVAPGQGLESIYNQLSTQAPHCSFISLIKNMEDRLTWLL